MVALVRKSGSEFLVNTQTAGFQFFPTIDALPGGGFIVAWLDQGLGMRAQRFDGLGAKVGGEIVLNTTAFQPGNVSVLASGNFVVTWAPQSPPGAISGRLFDASGNPQGEVFTIDGAIGGQETVFDLVSGGFVVSWWDQSSAADSHNIRAQIFDAAGVKVGGEILVNSATEGVQNSPAGVALGSGDFVIVWTDQQGGADDPDLSIKGQIIDATGNPIGDNFLINTITESVQAQPDIAALPNGGFVVTWQSYDGTYRAKAQVFDAAGNKIGSEVLASTPGEDVTSCSVTALPWGGFLVAWENYAPSGANRWSVRAQMFDGEGNTVGSQFQINSEVPFANLNLDLTTLASGQVVATWTNEEGGAGERDGVKAQILLMPAVGTSGDDILVGGVDADYFAGLAGNDYIIGGDGADSIEGNAGDDTIEGGNGDDILSGGDGADIIDGGLGVNTLLGDAGNDRFMFSAVSIGGTTPIGLIDGGADDDTIDFRNVSPVLLGTIEVSAGVFALGAYVGSQRYEIRNVEHILFGDTNDNIWVTPGFNGTIELRGGGGNDDFQVNGSTSAYGEDGDDSFFLSGKFGAPPLTGVLDGGSGNDLLKLNISFTVDLAAGTAVSGVASYAVAGIERVQAAATGGYVTTIRGSDAAETFAVNPLFNDGTAVVLDGRGGNDIIAGGRGDDDLSGGDGFDIVSYAAAASGVSISLAVSIAQATGGDGTDILVGFEGIEGSAFADVLTGDGTANDLRGGEGNDVLDGGLGNDVLDGGGGLDTALFSGVRSASQFGRATDGTITVVGPDGTDMLVDVERLQFADGMIKVAFAAPASWTSQVPVGGRGWHVGDFDGDGKDDIFRYAPGQAGADMFLSDGTRFESDGSWTGAGNGDEGWHVGDFDGDGKDDIFRYVGQLGTEVFLSNGDSFLYNGNWTGAGNGNDGWYVGDFNGDGRDDVARYFLGTGVQVFASNGSGFAYAGIWTGAGSGDIGWQIGDFNGDGRDDFARYLSGTGVQVFASNGSGFDYAGIWTAAGNGDIGWQIGDFNGDGRDDFARYLSGTGVQVFASNGSGFDYAGRWSDGVAGLSAGVGDFNGDGNSDLMRVLPGGTDIFL
ncbi:MAG: hypothetical protein AB7I42_30315 [Bradyrhizobium sp.]|uniref:calcium-binding protein n=1 Tax=Bradyrhizobium sp. TaxID=376 RepID=UPI003D11A7A5